MAKNSAQLRYAQGIISTQNLVPAGVATPNSTVEMDVEDISTLAIQTIGTYTGVLTLQATLNGTTWVSLTGLSTFFYPGGSGSQFSAGISSGYQGLTLADVSAYAKVRISANAAVTGSVNVTLRGDDSDGAITQVMVDTELPAAAAISDALANPTAPQAAADLMQFNESTWERKRGNVDTTTGDTGAKTATFTGATQTNRNSKGAFITLLLGTVTGTTPQMVVQPQWSPDGGTTWINFGPSLTITATGNYGFLIHPANLSQSAGATPANLTTGLTAQAVVNAPLPRTWRLNYTITGTSPSFTISSVRVNYWAD